MHVLFNLESSAGLLHAHADDDVEVFIFESSFFVVLSIDVVFGRVGIFHILTLVVLVKILVDAIFHKIGVELVHEPIFSGEIDHRAGFHLLVDHEKRRNSSSFGYESIVGTEGWSDVNDSGTIFGSNIVSGDNAETVFVDNNLVIDFVNGLYPWEKLLVGNTDKLATRKLSNHAVGDDLVASLVIGKVFFGTVGSEIGAYALLSHNADHRCAVVGVECLESNVLDLWTDAKCGV